MLHEQLLKAHLVFSHWSSKMQFQIFSALILSYSLVNAGAIHDAAFDGDIDTFRSLVNGGVDINVPHEVTEWTPWQYAKINVHNKFCEKMEIMGAYANEYQKIHRDAAYGDSVCIQNEIDNGISVIILDDQLLTPMDRAALNNQVLAIELLHRLGSPLYAVGPAMPPIMYAARYNNIAAINALLTLADNEGTIKEIINEVWWVTGWTALHMAANFQHYELCETLIRHGASTRIKDKKGRTPAKLALLSGSLVLSSKLASAARKEERSHDGNLYEPLI